MNIFALDPSPIVSAQMMCDKHVVKMIVETAQLLSTAHRMIDGIMYVEKTANGRSIKRWRLPDNREICYIKQVISIIQVIFGLVKQIITTLGYIVILWRFVKNIHIDMIKFI